MRVAAKLLTTLQTCREMPSRAPSHAVPRGTARRLCESIRSTARMLERTRSAARPVPGVFQLAAAAREAPPPRATVL